MADQVDEDTVISSGKPERAELSIEEEPTDEAIEGSLETVNDEGDDGPSNDFPLDPEIIQQVKDWNRAAGICDACQELFISICKIKPGHVGEETLDPFGNVIWTNVWAKELMPTLFYFPHSSLSTLAESAKTGCGTCRVFLESLNVYRNAKYHEPISNWFVAARRQAVVRPEWIVWLHSQSKDFSLDQRAEGFTLDLIPTSGLDVSHPISGQNSVGDNLPLFSPEIPQCSSEALHLAKSWLKDCENNHKSCVHSQAPNKLFRPTRLLSVGDASPCLCLTSSLPSAETMRYAALSHCWGDLNDLIRLTKANLIDFQREIPPAALCKTFRHAIETTKALGLHFLWIDSICIIQDDAADWATEASLMCEVYSCCTISIAASSAVDGNGGCFFSRDPGRRWIQPIKVIRDNSPAEFVLLNTGFEKQRIEDTPLSTRAWALQGNVLAPRTLHFSSSQIYWECREKEACETLPRGYFQTSILKHMLPWHVIVENYSLRSLTYPEDKLPALAGLAMKAHQETKGTYVAGLWLETLTWDLWWNVRRFMNEYQKPKYSSGPLNLAPSWSWAAVDAIVELPPPKEHAPFIDFTDHIFVLDVEGLPSGKAAFGQIHQAALFVECEVLIPFHLQEYEYPLDKSELLRYVEVHDTVPLCSRVSFDYMNVPNGLKFLLALHTRIERIGDSRFSPGYALSEPANSAIIAGGLILEKTGLGRGEYRRVGTFKPEFRSETEVQNWVKVPKRLAPDLKEADYIKKIH